MRKLLVVAAIAAAGCAARTPEQKPVTPQQRPGTTRTVEVATFTAEVDPAAGTFKVSAHPTAAGRALGMSQLVEMAPAAVSLANTVDPDGIVQIYFNVDQRDPDRLCTNEYAGPVWGANLTITNLVPNTTLSDLHTVIQTFTGPPGTEVCNSVTVDYPSVLPLPVVDTGLGVWSSPVLVDNVTTQDWVFQYVTAGYFTFSGVFVASVAELLPNGPTYPTGYYGLVDNGVGVVYSSLDAPQLVFLEPGTGGTWSSFKSKALPDLSWSLTKDAARGKIWYATDNSVDPFLSYVGYVNAADHGLTGVSIDVQGATLPPLAVKPWAIEADPDPTLGESRAWFVASTFDYSVSDYVAARLFRVHAEPALGAIVGPTPVATLDGPFARSLVFGDADNIYVTLAPTLGHPNGAIQRCTRTGCGTTPDIISLPAGCESPDVIVVTPTTGKLWFTVGVGTAAGGVCTVDPLLPNLVERVADASFPGYLAVAPGGVVWVGEYASGEYNRVQRLEDGYDSLLQPYSVSTDFAPVYGAAWALDALWVLTSDGVDRIRP